MKQVWVLVKHFGPDFVEVEAFDSEHKAVARRAAVMYVPGRTRSVMAPYMCTIEECEVR